MASLIYWAAEAEVRLGEARELLAGCEGLAAASAWNGLLAVRFLAPEGRTLVADLARFLTGFRGRPLPRTWIC
jgi:urease accessory protein